MVSRPLHFITWFCVGLLGPLVLFGIGLWVYGSLVANDQQRDPISSNEVVPEDRQSRTSVSSNQGRTPPSDDVESLLVATDDYARSVAFRAILSSADQQQLIALLEQSKAIRNFDQRLTTRIEIFRRFAVIAPEAAMLHTSELPSNRRTPIVEAIFLEWASSDVDAALTHLRTLGSADQRTGLEAILRIRNDWSTDRTMELALEFGHESLGADILEERQIMRAFDDPRGAWKAILEDSRVETLQYDTLKTILELWVDHEGFDVVFEAMDSISQIYIPWNFLIPILVPIAREDPEYALELIDEFSEEVRRTATFTVVHAWADTDPLAALKAVTELENYPEHVIDNLLTNVGWDLLGESPYEAVEHLPQYLSRNSRKYILQSAMRRIVRDSPQDATKLINEIAHGVEDLGGELALAWAREDASAALNWINAQEETLQPMLLLDAIPALVEVDPDLALSTALNQKIPNGQLGLEYEVIRTLAQSDIARATAMLPQVRAGETKSRACAELGRVMINQNESVAAIKLGSELAESLQYEYFQAIINELYNQDRVALYEVLDLLPHKFQSDAAIYFHRSTSRFESFNRSHWYFTDEQLEKIESYRTF
ncbi:MAG: hypothetical protein OXH31_05805 [Gammaproteobacteria bacterium]|nr:hypothetical protein [Gammaproteobacteria bacterium]